MEENEEECTDCAKVLKVEVLMGIAGLVAGVLIVAFAADLLLGGRIAQQLDSLAGGTEDE